MSKPAFDDLFNYREGRRNRKSMIIFMLAQMAISLILMLIILSVVPHLSQVGQGIAGLIVLAISVPIVISQFVVMTQRCRDLNRSGWLILLNFVPFISTLFQIYLIVAPGTDGKNKYGEDPLKEGQDLS